MAARREGPARARVFLVALHLVVATRWRRRVALALQVAVDELLEILTPPELVNNWMSALTSLPTMACPPLFCLIWMLPSTLDWETIVGPPWSSWTLPPTDVLRVTRTARWFSAKTPPPTWARIVVSVAPDLTWTLPSTLVPFLDALELGAGPASTCVEDVQAA